MLIEQRKQLELLFAFRQLFTEYNDARRHQTTFIDYSVKIVCCLIKRKLQMY